MGIKEAVVSISIKKGIKMLKEDFDTNSLKLIDLGMKLVKEDIQKKALLRLREGLTRPGNMWADYVKKIFTYTDADILEKLAKPFLNTFVYSYDIRKENILKHNCNVPWAILVDPTTACNLHCTGCWAADYSKTSQLSYDNMNKIITEGKALGTFAYLYTGGEPLMKKDLLIRLCEENPDCLFMAFTNGTLVDEKFADDLKRVGNMWLIFSIEGNEETTDARRGAGTYKAVLHGMELLRNRGIPFGASLCYTKLNAEVIASDEYADFLIDLGVLFAWYFTFVPVGVDSTPELMATAEQRELMYNQIRKWRFKPGEQKPFFTIDFFNDGEYVGGCIAGGKQYFHISPNGDCEPCVFAHYSTVNIKDENTHLLDVYKSPMFMAYRQRQPFSPNMLRPCPVMDQPGAIKKMVHETGAKSTDYKDPENVDDLFSKTVDVARKWKETADKMADEYGFTKIRLRSFSMYDDIESERLHDFNEFE